MILSAAALSNAKGRNAKWQGAAVAAIFITMWMLLPPLPPRQSLARSRRCE
jgi:hypothetical protein